VRGDFSLYEWRDLVFPSFEGCAKDFRVTIEVGRLRLIEEDKKVSERDRLRSSPLETERGSTDIEDGVVSKIVGMAAREAEGVRMGGRASRTAGEILGG
jgi:hypothetical protein